MHLALDAHMVGERETGNETYTLNLAAALLRLIERDPKGFSWDALGPANATQPLTTRRSQQRRFGDSPRLSLLTPDPPRLTAALPQLAASPHSEVLPLRPAQALLRIPLGLPWAAWRYGFDLLHVTYNAPPLNPCPTVVTIHDISFEHYPQFFSPRDLLILKTLVPLSARRAAQVITVSEHARSEIIERYGLPAHKVSVTYEAAGEQFQPVHDGTRLHALRSRYDLGTRPYVLALGNLQPRKNMVRLVQAFARAAATLPDPPLLVLAGKALWRESEVYTAVQQAGVEALVRFPGYVADEDLPALYSAAELFVYPSLYEGFGLPPLEAMACATPVISSDVASLPEVVGDAALMINPHDTDSLAHALHLVLSQPTLRAELSRRGPLHAATFSWDRCARQTMAAYARALGRAEAL
ncbi:MAG: glycosyltransferase family 1 protein [Caldilineales bacterium]